MDINMKLKAMPQQEQKASVSGAKKTYTIIGLALFTLVAVTILLQYLANIIYSNVKMSGNLQTAYIWIATFGPMYLFGIPSAIFIMKKLPVENIKKEKLGFRKFIRFMVIAISFFYIGNYIGNALGRFFTGGVESNGILAYSLQNNIYKVIFLVFLAPIIEEFLFRKQIIDRCAQYGEGQAIMFSALSFAIFHMNIYQFFYALGVGLVFGYVYASTRNIKLSMAMHILLNSMGSVIAPWIMSKTDLAAANKIAAGQEIVSMNEMNGVLLFVVYALTLFILTFAGIILLIVKRKQFVVREKENQLLKGERLKNIYLNPGFILFTGACVVITVMALI